MAGSLEVTAFTHVEGPFMHANIGAVLDEFDKDVRHTIAEKGVKYLKEWPFKSHRGGGFEANLRIVEQGATLKIPGPQIRGVTWSPWLEGVSKRNSSTRFPGYGLFKKTAGRLQDEAGDIGDEVLKKYMPRLGGD